MNHRYMAWAAAAFAGLLGSTSAHAVLVNHGITYSLTETDTANAKIDRFTLQIDGINGAADDEGNRTGVDAIAFNQPTGYVGAMMVSPPGWIVVAGGLDSDGCKTNAANFVCFDNPLIVDSTNIPHTQLAANSSLTYVFDLETATGDFAGYDPSFKINWVGGTVRRGQFRPQNYDLVSKEIGITRNDPPPCTSACEVDPPALPEPASLAMLSSALLGAGFLLNRRRRDDAV